MSSGEGGMLTGRQNLNQYSEEERRGNIKGKE
jgi:hypothetical protein